jgi:hypothetical protein
MTARATHSTPLLHVAEIERSIRFYELLGFVVIDTDRCTPLGWARLHCNAGEIMFLRAERPIDPQAQGFLFYLYTPELPALREHLAASGVAAPPIQCPGYLPSGTMSLSDPDGYRLELAHWGRQEHEAWLRRIEAAGTREVPGT